ncbi:MAG: autotransporter-associated beta strand repeat-containing protein [Luteolibacter sp.]
MKIKNPNMKKTQQIQLISAPASRSQAPWLITAAAIVLSAPFASAAANDYFWNPDGVSSPAAGGSGSWNTSSLFWRNNTNTGTLVAYPSTGTTNIANFGGTAGTVTLASSTNLLANQLIFSTPGYTINGASGSKITLNGTTPTITNAGATTINAVIDGTAGLTAVGGGTTTLTGLNTFTGGITSNRGQNVVLDHTTNASGVVVTGNAVNLGTSTGGGTLTIKGNSAGTSLTLGAVNFYTGQNTIVVEKTGAGATSLALGTLQRNTAGVLLFDLSSGGTVTANIPGGSPVNLVDSALVAGSGSTSSVVGFVRSGTNTYDFATGSSAANGASITALSSTTELVTSGGANTNNYRVTSSKIITATTNGGTIRVDTTAASGGNITINAGQSLIAGKNSYVFDGTGNFDIAGPGTFSGNAGTFIHQWSTGTVTIGSNVGLAAQAFAKYGSGLLVNNSTSTNPNALNIFGGVYRAGTAGALSSGLISLGTSGVLELRADFTRTLGSSGANIQFLSDGGFSASGGTRVVAFNGTGSPTALTWASTGSFLLNGNKLILSASTSDSTVDFRNAIDFNGVQREVNVGNGTAAVDALLSGVLSSTTLAGGGLYKSGAGTLSVTNANTYNGITTVNAGTLLVNNTSGSGTGSGTVSVGSGGALGGTGSISGATTISSGGIYTAGDKVTVANTAGTGTIAKETFTASINYNAGSIFEWNLTGTGTVSTPNGTRGTDYDAVNTASVTGGSAIFRVVLNGSQNFSDAFWDTDRTWSDIFTNVGGGTPTDISAIFSSFEYSNAAGAVSGVTTAQGAFSFTGGSGTDLKWTAVPEPTSALAGLLITAGLLRRRRNV